MAGMRVNDLKQILWWLAGGLLICAAVLVAILVVRPSKSRFRDYSLWAENRAAESAAVDERRSNTSKDFQKEFGATYTTRIDGIEPEKPPPPPPPPPPPDPKPKVRPPLSKFMDVVAIWTNVAFYRPKNARTRPEEVVVGKWIPGNALPGFKGDARLIRIDARESPFRAVFLANGKEEIFLVPQPAVILKPGPQEQVATLEDYTGPAGLVTPIVRKVGPVGVKRGKDDDVIIGRDIQALISNDSEGFLKDIAWDTHPKGVAISKIREGSRIDMLNKELGGGVLQDGDVIQSVNGVKVQSKAQIINHFRQNPVKPGSSIKVEIFRARQGRTIFQSFTAPAAK